MKLNQFQQNLLDYLPFISDISILAIDPASGGTSNIGWAIYTKGKLQESGEIKIKHGPIQQRLNDLFKAFSEFDWGKDKLVVIEKVRSGQNSHIYLTWAVAVILAALNNGLFIEISSPIWRKYKPENYVKSDRGDAELIGHAFFQEAKKLEKDLSL